MSPLHLEDFIGGEYVEAPTGRRTELIEGGRFDADALVPPVNNGSQLQRVLGLIDRLPGHATVTAGGRREGEHGCYVEPAVVVGLEQCDEMIQNEVFGPVIAVQTFQNALR